MTLLAERGACRSCRWWPPGWPSAGDALLVTESAGRPFGSLAREESGDGLLDALWRSVAGSTNSGSPTGRSTAIRLLVRPDGSPALERLRRCDGGRDGRGDPVGSRTAAGGHGAGRRPGPGGRAAAARSGSASDPRRRRSRSSSPPCSTGRPAGRDRDRDARRPPGGGGLSRRHRTSRARTDPAGHRGDPSSGRPDRVVAYLLIAAIAGVDLQQLRRRAAEADTVWLLAALLLAPVVQIAQAFSTMGASILPVRFVPVLMLEYAIQFIQLAVPSSAARVALEIRFFQRKGVEVGRRVSIGLDRQRVRLRDPDPLDRHHHGHGPASLTLDFVGRSSSGRAVRASRRRA